jgi:nucleoside-diphosphate-sugar epimerase
VLITGAAGFVGARVAESVVNDPRFDGATVTLIDTVTPRLSGDGVRPLTGDLSLPNGLELALEANPNIVIHLAGVLGGAAEADYGSARRVNLDATLNLFERLRELGRRPRVVFASSVAVFGPPLPEVVRDDSPPHPTMTYGAQKLQMEVALEQFSARGWLDGIALRLPGIVARPGADRRLRTAFLSTLFYAIAAGEDVTLPVSPKDHTWLLSVEAAADAFIHACLLPRESLGRRRAFMLPALRVSIEELVAAVQQQFPGSGAQVVYAPDADIVAQFASHPPLSTELADRLGFAHDGDVDRLVARAMPREGR